MIRVKFEDFLATFHYFILVYILNIATALYHFTGMYYLKLTLALRTHGCHVVRLLYNDILPMINCMRVHRVFNLEYKSLMKIMIEVSNESIGPSPRIIS
jgi:hypothetical protein